MPTASYRNSAERIEEYFDRTAAKAWEALTSDAPVSKIRQTVRAGRADMRGTLLSWLPEDMSGLRLLDAGCGPGCLAIEAARRGAEVIAVDISASLIEVAKARCPGDVAGRITWLIGDMLDESFGAVDYVVSMDALIHYAPDDAVVALERLAARTRRGILFTFAPRTPLLAAMHTAGKLFPRKDRSPAITPVSPRGLTRRIEAARGLAAWQIGRTSRVDVGFYKSQGLELLR